MASELWQRLRTARKFADLRQEDISKVCKVTRSAVAQWEAKEVEKRTTPSIDQVRAIAKLCKLPVEWMLNDSANTDDVWEIGKLHTPANIPVATLFEPGKRLDSAFEKAIEFELLQRKPELAEGFNRIIPLANTAIRPDFWYGKTLIELKTSEHGILDACAQLLLVEKAVGGKCKKAVLVYGPADQNLLASYGAAFGIDVLTVTSPTDAADYIVANT